MKVPDKTVLYTAIVSVKNVKPSANICEDHPSYAPTICALTLCAMWPCEHYKGYQTWPPPYAACTSVQRITHNRTLTHKTV